MQDYGPAWLQDVFDRRLPLMGFAAREPQSAMAGFVATALAKNRHLLAEAGVGTGKTFAYLIPLLAHMQRDPRPVIIATHTIALQRQLMQDLPAIARVIGLDASAQLAKGKEHYACKAAIEAFDKTAPAGPDAQQLLAWGKRSMTGDRAQAPVVSEAVWQRVAWGEASPCGARCKFPERCGAGLVRRRWQEAEGGLIITNHHQFFADLALRARGAHLFPQAGAIVLDEAHAALDAAREMLGARAAPGGLAPALQGALRQLDREVPGADALLARARALPGHLAQAVDWGQGGEEAERWGLKADGPHVAEARALADASGRLLGALGGLSDRPARALAIERLASAVAPLRGLLDPQGQVAWAEGDPRARRVDQLAAAPRDLATIFRERLFQRQVPVILTSATLATEGDFGWAQAAFGLEKPLRCLADSPFDYANQARLYIAADLPDPSKDPEAFYRAAHERLAELTEALGGRGLALFTARSRTKAAQKTLATRLSSPVWAQGGDAATALNQLQEAEAGLLLGTAYWTGVDVPGLNLVALVKLPFPAPDPLIAAQEQAARARGEDPFEAVLLPAMLLKLRQGAGRLIRREADRGIIAILDPRAASRSYAERITASLPEDLPTVTTVAEAAAFVRG